MGRSLLFAAALCGCSTDLLVGDPDSTGTVTLDPDTSGPGDDALPTSGDAEGEGTSTTEATSLDGSDADTTDAPTTGRHPTTGEDATGAETETHTTGERTTGEPLGCAELLYEACVDDPECAWFGAPEAGTCSTDPCLEEPGGECAEIGFEDCVDSPGCQWIGEIEGGACHIADCSDCGRLEQRACQNDRTCTWNPREMLCQPA